MDNEKKDRIVLLEASGNAAFPDDFLNLFHTHLICHRGSLDFVFNDRPYTCKTGDFVFWFADSKVQI